MMGATVVYPARRIITLNPMQPRATHVAVRDGRILSVGTLDDVSAWGAHTLDARFADHVLMPGLVEGHSHLKEGSMWDMHYLGWFDRRDPLGKLWGGLRSTLCKTSLGTHHENSRTRQWPAVPRGAGGDARRQRLAR